MRRAKVKYITDAAMSLAMLCLMAYGLVGEAAHEWIGVALFVLFVLHHVLNRKWILSVRKGSYTPYRVLQTVLFIAILLCMIGSMLSGIFISRHVFAFLPKHGGEAFFGKLHMLSAYWGFVLMSVHLGLHWNRLLLAARGSIRPNKVRTWVLRVAGYLFAAYGVAAFVRREIGSYLLLQSHFVFFDYTEPLIFFLFDYLAVMALFVLLGYALAHVLRRAGK